MTALESTWVKVAELRYEVLEFIEVALVELRGEAQPQDLAALRELSMDANDAESLEQLEGILAQAKNLRRFCENRAKSLAGTPRIRW